MRGDQNKQKRREPTGRPALAIAFVLLLGFVILAGCSEPATPTKSPASTSTPSGSGMVSGAPTSGTSVTKLQNGTRPAPATTRTLYLSGAPHMVLTRPTGAVHNMTPIGNLPAGRVNGAAFWNYTFRASANVTGVNATIWIRLLAPQASEGSPFTLVLMNRSGTAAASFVDGPGLPGVLAAGDYELHFAGRYAVPPGEERFRRGDVLNLYVYNSGNGASTNPWAYVLSGAADTPSYVDLTGVREPAPT